MSTGIVTADGSVTQQSPGKKKKKKKKSKQSQRGEDGGSGSGSGENSDRSRSQSSSRSRAGALVPLADPDPPWSCACGFSCKESGRRAHLGSCRLFGRSWRAAFHALAQGVHQQKKAVQQAQAMSSGGEGGTKSAVSNQPMPLSIEQRIVALDKKVAHFVAKRSAAAVAAADNNNANDSANPSSPSARRTLRWWDRGLLLAALVESGGDVRRAAAKLCQGSGSASGGDKGNGSVLAAEAYRAEMRFVAESVEIVKMLAEHNELLQLTEM